MTRTPHFVFLAPPLRPLRARNTGDATTVQRVSLCDSWRNSIANIFKDIPNPPFTVIEGKLQDIEPHLLRGDCIVSPANSFGIMDVTPTMRMPEDVSWHQDLVYNSMWSLLVEIARWNSGTSDGQSGEPSEIGRVVMTGLGTGQGGIGAEKCAVQMVLAVKHFLEPLPESVRWNDIQTRMKEVEQSTEK